MAYLQIPVTPTHATVTTKMMPETCFGLGELTGIPKVYLPSFTIKVNPNVGRYTIHGCYGLDSPQFGVHHLFFLFFLICWTKSSSNIGALIIIGIGNATYV